jgi:hypothetical protein
MDDRVAFDRHGADLDFSAVPVAQKDGDLVIVASRASAHALNLAAHSPDVFRDDKGRIELPRAISECVSSGVVQPKDPPVRVADEARDVDPLKRLSEEALSRLARHWLPVS